MRIVYFLFILSLTDCVFSQKDFRKGYIITNSGDILYGSININTNLHRKCGFKIDNEKEEVYSPFDIKGFQLEDGKYYISKAVVLKEDYKVVKQIDKGNFNSSASVDRKWTGSENTFIDSVFLEFLVEGKINLYYLKRADIDHYFMEDSSHTMIDLTTQHVEIRKGGIQYFEIEDKMSKGAIRYFMKDAPQLHDKIDRAPIQHKSLIDLSADYHRSVCKDKECIIYERKIKSMKYRYFLGAGSHYSNYLAVAESNREGYIISFYYNSDFTNLFLTGGVLVYNYYGKLV